MNNKKSTTAPAPSGDESAPKFEIVPAKPDGNPATDVSLTPTAGGRLLTREEFRGLAEVPAEVEWFAKLDNPRTRAAYKIDVVHRDRHAEGFSGRDQIPRPRVAQKSGGTSTATGHDPPKTLGTGQPLRLFV
jgi:hypothetical protein